MPSSARAAEASDDRTSSAPNSAHANLLIFIINLKSEICWEFERIRIPHGADGCLRRRGGTEGLEHGRGGCYGWSRTSTRDNPSFRFIRVPCLRSGRTFCVDNPAIRGIIRAYRPGALSINKNRSRKLPKMRAALASV